MNAALLTLEDLTVHYGDRPAVRSVSCALAPGQLVALAGPNGSGKSTLFRAVAGLVAVQGGRVLLGDAEGAGLSIRVRASKVGWMPQEELEGDDLEVEEYVRYGRNPYLGGLLPIPDPDPSATERAMRETATQEFRRRPVRALSGGEKQRVRLARVLAQETPLVLLDEPTAHLDIGHQLDLLGRVRQIARRRDRCVVVALHDLNLAARFADRVLVLSRGQLVADGAPREVLSPALLHQVWGIEAELRQDARSQIPYLLPRLPAEPPVSARTRQQRVHVVAGGGSGTDLLPALVDHGYEVTAGALALFDSDSDLAEELHLACAREVPFAPISERTREELRELMRNCDAVIVAEFPVGAANLGNLEEVARLPPGTPVRLLRQRPGRTWDFSGGEATRLRARILAQGGIEVDDLSSLLKSLGTARREAETAKSPRGP